MSDVTRILSQIEAGDPAAAELRKKHVELSGGAAVFAYTGKSSKRQRQRIVNPELVKLVGRLVDDNGRLVKPRADVPAAWSAGAWDVPLTTDVIRAGAVTQDIVERYGTLGD